MVLNIHLREFQRRIFPIQILSSILMLLLFLFNRKTHPTKTTLKFYDMKTTANSATFNFGIRTLILICLFFTASTATYAQPICTSYSNNNGSSGVAFQLQNTTGGDIVITGIS